MPALLRPATLAQPETLNGKVTVTAPPPSSAVMSGSLARASAALPGLAGLLTTAQKVWVATFADGTVPSLLVLIWNPVSVFCFSLPPPIVCFLIAPPLIVCAA